MPRNRDLARTTPESIEGPLVVSRASDGGVATTFVEIERREDGTASFRVCRWLDANAKFGDERTIPLSPEAFAAIEGALFEPIDAADYVAAGTHAPCLDCGGEPGHRAVLPNGHCASRVGSRIPR